jgi:hypothetical protein
MRVTNFKSTKDSTLFAVYSNLYSRFDNRTGRVQAANINVNSNFSTKKMIISIMVLALHQNDMIFMRQEHQTILSF